MECQNCTASSATERWLVMWNICYEGTYILDDTKKISILKKGIPIMNH